MEFDVDVFALNEKNMFGFCATCGRSDYIVDVAANVFLFYFDFFLYCLLFFFNVFFCSFSYPTFFFLFALSLCLFSFCQLFFSCFFLFPFSLIEK